MKKKRKLKKEVWILLALLIFGFIAIFAGKKIYNNYQYKKTNEYKLIKIGYTKEEANILLDKLDDKSIASLINSNKNEDLLKIINEKYFMIKNLDRYLTYYSANKTLNPTKVVTIVNTNNDYQYYDHDINTDLEKDYLMLVNKYYHLNEEYEPKDLVKVSNKYYYGENHKLRQVAYDAFIDMWNAAKKENIYLIMNSSYRDYKEQKTVYDDYKDSHGTTYADSIAARPGYSEHQTGLSLDIFSKDSTVTTTFKDSKAYAWLKENAYKYGFIQRYTKESEDITGYAEETWHYRYVGVEVATYIQKNNITFDEYYAYFIEKN